jgi:deoxyribodipyrimidine photolyase-related protein
MKRVRRLVLVLGDQLWLGNPALAGFDPACDRVLMIEAASEATAVWSHKARIALFFSAMRHFRDELRLLHWPCTYWRLGQAQPDTQEAPNQLCELSEKTLSFSELLEQSLIDLAPETMLVCEPGEWRMLELVQNAASNAKVALQVEPDSHFMCSREAFARWAGDKKELRMEYFYREMRRQHQVLMVGKEPVGERWNLDADNRKAYPKAGPGLIPSPEQFSPDATTQEVFAVVQQAFGHHPGELTQFAWPVNRAQALQALDSFISYRLASFGPHQDAMWTDTPWGWHALLSTSLNLHLLTPHEVVAAAEQVWTDAHLDPASPPGQALLASVEGFIRQILGWREFIRGVYWLDMPQLKTANHYQYQRSLPSWYWTGQTQMACMKETIGQTLRLGYAHHIQRLMVTGQFAVLAQLNPQAVADWYLAVYVDAVEWVELPNVAGMALFANGGRFTSKPYIASGQYIKRMSNYCKGCRYQPETRSGDDACPMTTLYWHFLDQHESTLMKNPRTSLMAKNIARLTDIERQSIRSRATYVLDHLDDI